VSGRIGRPIPSSINTSSACQPSAKPQLLDADQTTVLLDFRDAWERRSGGMDGLLGLEATA
jgi:hypothetical protein